MSIERWLKANLLCSNSYTTLHQICSVVAAAVFVCWLELIIGGNCELSVTAHQQTIDHSNSLPPAQTMLRPRHHHDINPSNDSQIIYFIVQRQWLDTINRMRTGLQVFESPHNIKHIHSHYIVLPAGLNHSQWSESFIAEKQFTHSAMWAVSHVCRVPLFQHWYFQIDTTTIFI